MKVNNHFIVLTKDEFRDWLSKYKVARVITRLQVHHTWSPAYKDFRVGKEFDRLEAMRNFHMNTNGWKAIGQNITTFPNGLIGISLERNINDTPAGIKGANTGALCIENLGNFNTDGDKMSQSQKETIIHLYACLAEKLNIPIDTSHIVYHAWYTPDGDRLGDYDPKRSSKTCPGTNFWGDGNTITAAVKGFLPDVQKELNRLKGIQVAIPNKPEVKEEDLPMTAEEKKAFDALEERLKKVETKVNISGNQEPPVWAHDVIKKAKDAGIIKESNDKSQIFLEMLQALFNAGLIGSAKQ